MHNQHRHSACLPYVRLCNDSAVPYAADASATGWRLPMLAASSLEPRNLAIRIACCLQLIAVAAGTVPLLARFRHC